MIRKSENPGIKDPNDRLLVAPTSSPIPRGVAIFVFPLQGNPSQLLIQPVPVLSTRHSSYLNII